MQAVAAIRLDAQRRLERRVAWITLIAPALGAVAAVATFSAATAAVSLVTFAVMYAVTTLGITMGFHRHFTHRGFQASPRVRAALAVAGSMAAQGPLLFWVAAHRRHHESSDGVDDPHSPYFVNGRPVPALRGLLRAHVGWMVSHDVEDWARYAPDLLKDRRAVRWSFAYPAWVLLGLALPALAGLLVTRSADGALAGFLWGGLARMFAVHHTTWSVNSICHVLGSRPYQTGDRSTNHAAVALLTFGEGWHNNHHAFPTSARHGLTWWQLDLTWLAIRACAALGLVQRVVVPSAVSKERKAVRSPHAR